MKEDGGDGVDGGGGGNGNEKEKLKTFVRYE